MYEFLQYERSKDYQSTDQSDPSEVESEHADQNHVIYARVDYCRELLRVGSPLLKLLRDVHDESSRRAFGYLLQGR